MLRRGFAGILLGSFVLIGGCSQAGEEADRPEATLVVEQAPDGEDMATVAPTTAVEPPTATPKVTTEEQSQLVERAVPETPTPAASPTPDFPPAPHFNVEQAPYAESDCSDKYPCNEDLEGWEARMRVPPEFEINVFTRIDDRPTSITSGPDGLLYVAGLSGKIYTVDETGTVEVYTEGLLMPTGLAFQPGTNRLYVSSRITDINEGGEAQLSVIEDGQVTQLIDGLPCCYVAMHGPNGIAFGPDGYGYVGVGGRADHGEILSGPRQGLQDTRHPLEASILRFSPDGQLVEVYARGFRNPYDIAWDGAGKLYATDNGRDGNPSAGDEPPDELHEVEPGGEHGYPWFDCPVCFSAPAGTSVIPPLLSFPAHAAVTGVTAYLDDEYPGYTNDLFVVLWSAFPGAQKIVRVGSDRLESSDFATGFAQPIDVTTGADGNLYVIDFATGIIFQIRFAGNTSPAE